MTYGLSVKTSRGYAVPEVGAAYARARELCREVDDPARVVPVLIGLSAHHVVSGEIETSRDVALEMLDLFNRLGDPNLQMVGQWSLGAALFHLGELEVGHDHLRAALELYDPAFHNPRVWETGIDPGIFCRCELSRTLDAARLSRPGAAVRARSRRAGARARAPAAAGVRAAVPDARAPRAAGAGRGPAARSTSSSALCRRTASRRSCSGPCRCAAVRSWSSATSTAGLDGDRARPRGAHDHALDAAAAVLLHAVRGRAPARAAIRRRAQRALDEARGVADRDRPARVRIGAPAAPGRSAARARRPRRSRRRCIGSRWRSRAARGRSGSSCAPRAATRRFLIGAGRPDEARGLLRPVCDWFTEGRSDPRLGLRRRAAAHAVKRVLERQRKNHRA